METFNESKRLGSEEAQLKNTYPRSTDASSKHEQHQDKSEIQNKFSMNVRTAHDSLQPTTDNIDPSLTLVPENVSNSTPDHGFQSRQTEARQDPDQQHVQLQSHSNTQEFISKPAEQEISLAHDQFFQAPINPHTSQNLQNVQSQTDSDLADLYKDFERIKISTSSSSSTPVKTGNHSLLSASSRSSSTLVVLSTNSFNHTFSRAWTSKKYQESIVERPQRLLSASIGIGAAISFHSFQKTGTVLSLENVNNNISKDNKSIISASNANNIININDTISTDHFPTTLFSDTQTKVAVKSSTRRPNLRITPHVTKVHGSSWAKQLYDISASIPNKLLNQKIEVPQSWPYNDMYMGPGTMSALEGCVGATEDAVDGLYKPYLEKQLHHYQHQEQQQSELLLFDRALVVLRPPGHHCRKTDASGFCLLNNAHIAIQYAAQKYGVTHAVIFDFDLHHGDGTQDICWKLAGLEDDSDNEGNQSSNESSDGSGVGQGNKAGNTHAPKLAYFSLHDINSFPTEKGYATASKIREASVCVNAHDICIWNIHLEKFKTEQEFEKVYKEKYIKLVEKGKEFLDSARDTFFEQQENSTNGKEKREFRPLIVVSAGFDASENETESMRRHGVYVPTSFYHRFTTDVVELAANYKWSMSSEEYQNDIKNNKTKTDIVDTYNNISNAHGIGNSNGSYEKVGLGEKRYQRHEAAKIISLMEGGYSDGAVSTGVFAHTLGLISSLESLEGTECPKSSKDKIAPGTSNNSKTKGLYNIKTDDTKQTTLLTTKSIFNPFVTYHFEEACKPKWTPKSVYTFPTNTVAAATKIKRGKQLSERESRIDKAQKWVQSKIEADVGGISSGNGITTGKPNGDATGNSANNSADKQMAMTELANFTLKWIENGISLGRLFWPEHIRASKTMNELENQLKHVNI